MARLGRPPKYVSVRQFEQAAEDYFESCWADVPVIGKSGPVLVDDPDNPGQTKVLTEYTQVRPYTVTGLAVTLGLTRQGLLEYQGRPGYSSAVVRAKSIVEQYVEEQLFTGRNQSGPQFNLKNNFGWKDRSETALTGASGGPVIFRWQDDDA